MTYRMSPVADVAEVPTPASVWQGAAGREINDELLEWPPLFALTEILLERPGRKHPAAALAAAGQSVGFPPARRLGRRPRAPAVRLVRVCPSEGLDLEVVRQMLIAAEDEVDAVDIVCLPESAVGEGEIEDLEALLEDHRVIARITGVRNARRRPG